MPRNRDRAPLDPGLQRERTDLAWTRTALGFLANAALMARFARDTQVPPAAYAIAVALALTGALILAYARRLYAARTAAPPATPPAARPRALRAVWLATIAATVATTALALTTLLGGGG
jgi:uncharacterized membrane protein YidH (DUF202 family)